MTPVIPGDPLLGAEVPLFDEDESEGESEKQEEICHEKQVQQVAAGQEDVLSMKSELKRLQKRIRQLESAHAEFVQAARVGIIGEGGAEDEGENERIKEKRRFVLSIIFLFFVFCLFLFVFVCFFVFPSSYLLSSELTLKTPQLTEGNKTSFDQVTMAAATVKALLTLMLRRQQILMDILLHMLDSEFMMTCLKTLQGLVHMKNSFDPTQKHFSRTR